MRTIQKQKDSFVVTIPKDVMVERGWRNGDQLVFDIENDKVVIYRPKDRGKGIIYTIGYEGMVLDKLITALKRKGIEQLIDVRQNAISRKNGFSKEALRKALEGSGIMYTNIPELGSPKPLRDELRKNGQYKEFFSDYEIHLKDHAEEFERLKALALRRSTAIMCYEKNWKKCHRKVLSERFQKSGFQVFHI